MDRSKKMTHVKAQSIAHYIKMRAWVKTQDLDNDKSAIEMYNNIAESWHDESCSYCKEYYKEGNCGNCPLSSNDIVFSCCGDYWVKMDVSETWGEWLARSKNVLEYIKKCG